jgi:hypothetical protein
MWLCRPDLPHDACRIDLTATELREDGPRVVVPHAPAVRPAVDCFYVYPTVDMSIFPGNHTDLDDRRAIEEVARAQAASLGEACAVYAPLYRQITIGTYVWGAQQERRLEVAFSDVQDAFLHYLARYNHGRKIVLVGHSQGAEMIVRLLHRWFDGDPSLRARLLVAFPIGGPMRVWRGATTGGSLDEVPICGSSDETGCVIAYHSYAATGRPLVRGWAWDDPPGQASACVNPAEPGASGWRPLARSVFPSKGALARFLTDDARAVTTPFVEVRDRYYAACVNDDGRPYLAVAPSRPGAGPLRLDAAFLRTGLGLHVLDVQLALGDLIEQIRRRTNAAPARLSP